MPGLFQNKVKKTHANRLATFGSCILPRLEQTKVGGQWMSNGRKKGYLLLRPVMEAISGQGLFNKESLFSSKRPFIKTMVKVWSQTLESEGLKVLVYVK